MTDEQIMRALVRIEHAAFDPQTRARIADVILSGARVTVFEVTDLRHRPLLVIAHATPAPSMASIRRAYEQVHARSLAS